MPVAAVSMNPDTEVLESEEEQDVIVTQVEVAAPDGPSVERRPSPDVLQEDPKLLLERYRRRAVICDAAAAMLAGLAAVGIRFGPYPSQPYVLSTAVAPAIWLIAVALQHGYEFRFLSTGPEEYRRLAQAGLTLFTGLVVASFVVHSELSRAYVLVSVPGTVLLSLSIRHFLRRWIYRARVSGRGLQKVLVVGRADAAAAVIEKLDHEPQHGLVAIGACVPGGHPGLSQVQGVPVVGDLSQILQAVVKFKVHLVAVVSHPDLSGQALRRLGWALEEHDVELVVSPGIIEVAGPRLSIRPMAGLSLLHLERPTVGGSRMIGKNAFDRVAGLAILAILAPVLAVISLAVKLTSAGPVIFRQTRVGVDGREFKMLKFRSMVVDAEARRAELLARGDGNGVLFKMKKDPRVTSVGSFLRRFSLDELPQLWNVVRGDMSLVGPRPPLPEEVAKYSSDATRRLRVRPGLTGLWQVSGRSDLSWEESLQLDLRYVDNWTLTMDLVILWRTAHAVIRGDGAY
jgi:exopolysaccharide biosynthesis polyprenyl glycosylphosphotransferase